MITVNDKPVGSNIEYVLGGPFFRSYQVLFDYATNNITIFESTSVSPIVPSPMYPTADESLIGTDPVGVSNRQNYYGAMGLGASDETI
jgi:hypothetical protein